MSFYQNYDLPLDCQHGATFSCTTPLITLTSTADGPQLEEPSIQSLDYFPTPTAQCAASIMSPPAVPYSYGYASNGGGPPYSHMSPPQSTTWTDQSGANDSVLLGHQVYMSDAPTVDYWGAAAQMLQSQQSYLPATHGIANEYDRSVEIPSAPFVEESPVYTESFHGASVAHVDNDLLNQAERFTPETTMMMTAGDMDLYFTNPAAVTPPQHSQPHTSYTQDVYWPAHLPTTSSHAHTVDDSSPVTHISCPPYHIMMDHRRGASFPDGLADDVRTWVAQKPQIYDGREEGPSIVQHRHSLRTTDEGDRPPPDGERGLVVPTSASPDGGQRSGKTLTNTNSIYKTFVLEDGILREQQDLAGTPSAEPGSSTQRGPNRPAKHGRDVAARRRPRVAGNSGSNTNNGASSSSTGLACIWPVGTAPNDKPCLWTFPQSQNMLQHVRKKHLRVAIRCPDCGTYIAQRLRTHQETLICRLLMDGNDLEWERRARNALQRIGAMGIVNGRELSDGAVRKLVNALRPLIEAGRSQPKDIVDGIDAWMREGSGAEWGWQRSTDIVWTRPTAHTFPS